MSAPLSERIGSRAPSSRQALLSGLRTNIWLLATVVIALAVYHPSLAALVRLWEDTDQTTYTHGYLILAIALWLVVRAAPRQRPASRLGSSPVTWGSVAGALALTSLAWLVAVHAGLQIAHELLLPVVAWLAVLGAFGPSAARAMLFPLAFLYFAMPLWDVLNGTLQSISTVVVGWLVRIVGIPAWLEGNFVHIPGGTFEIAGGCSGLHYFIVGTAIAALYGEIHRDTPGTRLKLLALGVGLSLVTNWLRILIIIGIGHREGMGHPWVQDHYTLGWVVFGVAMVGFFAIVRRFPASAVEARPSGVQGSLKPSLPAGYAVAGALLLGPVLLFARPAPPEGLALGSYPASISVDSASGSTWRPVFPGADVMERIRARGDTGEVEVLTVAYRTQSQGAELVGYGVDLVGSGQELLAAMTVDVGGQRWREYVVQDHSGGRGLIWFVYLIDSRPFVSGLPAQLWYGVNAVFGSPLSGLLALRVTCDPGDCDGARRVLEGFAAEQAGALRERFTAASG